MTVIQQWIEALRSGKYKQGRAFLHREIKGQHEFCCLGVLCDLAVKANIIPLPLVQDRVEFEHGKLVKTKEYGYGNNFKTLPGVVKNWGEFPDNLFPSKLILMNDAPDEIRKSFTEIAEYLEKL